jgi:hypothetical protein
VSTDKDNGVVRKRAGTRGIAMIGLYELLGPRGLDLNANIKLVRHQDKRIDVDLLEREGLIGEYQGYQSKPHFHDCEYVVSFLGLEKSRARFHGVYRMAGWVAASERLLPAECKYPWLMPSDPANAFFYDLHEIAGFEDLKGRVVIDWGKSALAWHQWLSNKQVVEVLPAGYVREFPGYLDFVLRYDELVRIVENEAANREWHRVLAAVAGVYLIVDQRTGKQYVGSAYGEAGILARWRTYVQTGGHGGNRQLLELAVGEAGYARDFTFTILRTLPRTLTRAEVIAHECRYKQKLGSRAFGLNSN